MTGLALRMRRLFPRAGRGLFAVPLDHSVSLGPVEGLERIEPLAETLQAAGADLLIATRGAARRLGPLLRPPCLLGVHVSVSTALSPTPDAKVLAGSATEALALGADLLSVQVNFGTPDEGTMLRDLGVAADQCRALGLPLLCMAYVKRPGPIPPEEERHAARAVADLGADVVKTSYPGDEATFRALVRSTPVPLLIGGGPRMGEAAQLLERVRESRRVGGAGVCIGRNLFQRQPLEPLAREIAGLLHAPAPSA